MKDKIVPLLVVTIIGGAFAIGWLYGKVSVYEKGMVAGTQTQTGKAAEAQVQPQQAQEPEAPLTEAQWQGLVDKANRVEGKDNAKVTMVEFTDFQCPFCSRYYTDTYLQIRKDYVETGKVRYLTFDLPLPFHSNAKPAALATRCALDQDKYYEMHDKLFEVQTEWSEGDAKSKFVDYAKELGLNVATFTQCYESGKYNQAIEADATLANSLGANGTPSFFINGQRLVGAQPISAFTSLIDSQL